MPVQARRRLTALEFETVRPLLASISDERLEAARQCLVEGRTLKVVADRYGWSRQAVNKSVDRVWSTVEQQREGLRQSTNASAHLPPGWEMVTLAAPSHLVEKFRQEIAAATDARASPAAPPAKRRARPRGH